MLNAKVNQKPEISTYFNSRCEIQIDQENLKNVRYHTGTILLFFRRLFGMVVEVKDTATQKTYWLNKNSLCKHYRENHPGFTNDRILEILGTIKGALPQHQIPAPRPSTIPAAPLPKPLDFKPIETTKKSFSSFTSDGKDGTMVSASSLNDSIKHMTTTLSTLSDTLILSLPNAYIEEQKALEDITKVNKLHELSAEKMGTPEFKAAALGLPETLKSCWNETENAFTQLEKLLDNFTFSDLVPVLEKGKEVSDKDIKNLDNRFSHGPCNIYQAGMLVFKLFGKEFARSKDTNACYLKNFMISRIGSIENRLMSLSVSIENLKTKD